MRNSTNPLPLTVVIPCADDTRIKDCLDSIDENVEIIVVLNDPSKKVIDIVDSSEVRKVKIRERNLPKALNIGIEKATNPNVILMDSDCRFESGAIKKLLKGLQKYYIAKGKVIFQSHNFLSRIIAKAREYSYYEPPKPYNPFLGIKKSIKKHIGGYYFDETIHWTEDADLNTRLKKAKVKINYVFSARVFHPPLTLKHDLRSAFRYGIGKRIRVEKGVSDGIGTHFGKVLDVVIKKGVLVGIYYAIWNCLYLLGFIYQITSDPYKVKPLINRKE